MREYLQYKMLAAAFQTPYGARLAFLGGTCIHIVHGNPRFSEDLDFDNRGLGMDEFSGLVESIRHALILEGYSLEVKITSGGAFRANFRFLRVLQEAGITGHREEKLLIHFDAEPQRFSYSPALSILNKFDVFCRIQAAPIDLLLSQKIACIMHRRRPKGRDIFDAAFLWGMTQPDYSYLAEKVGMDGEPQMWRKLHARCQELDFRSLAREVQPFLLNPSETSKVLLFPEFVVSRL
ncbi:MAG: nucleotidyl transferase AbiEii/AbiGii toxin family protein [Kiritimatiellae bacterium]|nr:nucleotidyl transferase AbiEii/AbiGii toxin family protein [Kiritimatiellia bacterium]